MLGLHLQGHSVGRDGAMESFAVCPVVVPSYRLIIILICFLKVMLDRCR